jgi:hypothetical protein
MLGVGAANKFPYYTYRKGGSDSGTSSATERFHNNRALYISYDASVDGLYVSISGYGADNAWQTFPGLLQGQWEGDPLFVWLPANSEKSWETPSTSFSANATRVASGLAASVAAAASTVGAVSCRIGACAA